MNADTVTVTVTAGDVQKVLVELPDGRLVEAALRGPVRFTRYAGGGVRLVYRAAGPAPRAVAEGVAGLLAGVAS